MASTSATIYSDKDTDYGSDFSEELVEKLIAEATLYEKEPAPPLRDIEDIADFNHVSPTGMRKAPLPKGWEIQYPILPTIADDGDSMDLDFPTATAEPVITRTAQDLSRHREPVQVDPKFLENFLAANEREAENDKSPLERFKPKDKQALSVTDLTGLAWCELQTFYQLRTGRRKPATRSMKQGTKIHKALEEQIMTPVVVETTKKQDAWGLKFMNTMQGLKTLRETGMTRELEVWGVVGGQVVNGIIDHLSYACPDEELECDFASQVGEMYSPPPPYQSSQKTISEYFRPQSSGSSLHSAMGGRSFSSATQDSAMFGNEAGDTRKIYITDVKTRSSSRLPTDAAFRGTKMQLMLYHYLLSQMASNSVNLELLASRYGLDTKATFSDGFIASMACLQGAPEPEPDNPECDDSDVSIQERREVEDILQILLEHNNVSSLWSLMITEFQKTFPNGKQSIGQLLNVEFRTPSITSEGGRVVGSKMFPMSENVLDMYTEYQLRWWRGEREPVGVMVEDAWKCGYCDFRAGCEWRQERGEEFMALAEKRRADKAAYATKEADVKEEEERPKRGRKKKVVIESESESTSESKKVEVPEEKQKAPAKRGRRNKVPVQDGSESDIVGVPEENKETPAKRGRRKKIPLESENQADPAGIPAENEKAPAKRGRKKKITAKESDIEAVTSAPEMAEVQAPVKRGRKKKDPSRERERE